MLLIQPRWNGTGGRAKNDLDARLVQMIQGTLHPSKLKISVARLPTAPRRFPDANDRDARLSHHLDILVETVVWHILRVVRNAVQHCIHLIGSKLCRTLSEGARREHRQHAC